MTQAPFAAAPAQPRRPGPGLGISLTMIGLGLAIGIASVVAIVIPLVGTFTSPAYQVPGTFRVHLKHDRYVVFQHSGTRSGFGSVKDDVPLFRIDPAALSVRASDGTVVPVSFDSDGESLTRGTDVYTGSLVFEAPGGGEYDLQFSNTNPTTVVIARSLTDAVHSVLVWFATGALGGAVLIGGIVMLIVGATRRGRAKRSLQPGWGQPGWGQPGWGQPGWGAPPQWGPPPPAPPSPPPPPPPPPPAGPPPS